MANERATDRTTITVPVPIHIKRRAEKQAAKKGKALSTFVAGLIAAAVVDVPLTVDDYEEIAREIRLNEEKRMARRSGKG